MTYTVFYELYSLNSHFMYRSILCYFLYITRQVDLPQYHLFKRLVFVQGMGEIIAKNKFKNLFENVFPFYVYDCLPEYMFTEGGQKKVQSPWNYSYRGWSCHVGAWSEPRSSGTGHCS